MLNDPIKDAFLDALAIGESAGRYNVLYGGGTFSDYSKFPEWAGKDNSHAAGRYQFEPETWREEAASLGLTDFSPLSQDKAAWNLAEKVYARSGRDLYTDLGEQDFDHIVPVLHSTWTSLNGKFGARYMAALGKTIQAPPMTKTPTPPLHAGLVTGAASAYGQGVVILVWLFSLAGIAVPSNAQDAMVGLSTVIGGFILHRLLTKK